MFQNLLFDLDGTLTDSAEGITKCVQYALSSFGIIEPDLKKLYPYIGPPLRASFQAFHNLSPEQAEIGLKKYRERYEKIGIWENRVFPGMLKLLAELKEHGFRLGMATGKPEVHARRIAERFGLSAYLTDISGCGLGPKDDGKTEVVATALKKWGLFTPEEKATCLMIGDRKEDVMSAHACGIACLGAGFGFGSRRELEDAGADYYVHDIAELRSFLISQRP